MLKLCGSNVGPSWRSNLLDSPLVALVSSTLLLLLPKYLFTSLLRLGKRGLFLTHFGGSNFGFWGPM